MLVQGERAERVYGAEGPLEPEVVCASFPVAVELRFEEFDFECAPELSGHAAVGLHADGCDAKGAKVVEPCIGIGRDCAVAHVEFAPAGVSDFLHSMG